MKIKISNEIRIRDPAPNILDYCVSELTISNPMFYKLEQMGKWPYSEPEKVCLFEMRGKDLVLPFGCLNDIWKLHKVSADYILDLAPDIPAGFESRIVLRDYQEQVIKSLENHKNGVIISPCGSGKTTMALEIVAKLKKKTLWITHSSDLLAQSRDRAKEFLGVFGDEIGEITAGRAKIGSKITFSTVQTLFKWSGLEANKYTFSIVIVDEAHRCCVNAKSLGMFEKCLSSFAARHKFGLTATAHRSDGLIRGMYALLGECICEIDKNALSDNAVPVRIQFKATDYDYSDDCLDADGTIIFGKLQEDIALDQDRNQLIVDDLVQNVEHFNLVLSDRLFHLNILKDLLPQGSKAALIDGKTSRDKRKQALEDMREGRINYLFATYALAKEGLDLPRLDRLYMALPKRDYAVVIQSVGRIARPFEGKEDAIVYDYVDPIGMCTKMYRERQKHYRNQGYETNLVVLRKGNNQYGSRREDNKCCQEAL